MSTGHRSAYVDSATPGTASTWAGDLNVMQYQWANIEQLFRDYRVNLHYSGHTHVTQRHCASFQGACMQNATLSSDSGRWTYKDSNYTVYYR